MGNSAGQSKPAGPDQPVKTTVPATTDQSKKLPSDHTSEVNAPRPRRIAERPAENTLGQNRTDGLNKEMPGAELQSVPRHEEADRNHRTVEDTISESISLRDSRDIDINEEKLSACDSSEALVFHDAVDDERGLATDIEIKSVSAPLSPTATSNLDESSIVNSGSGRGLLSSESGIGTGLETSSGASSSKMENISQQSVDNDVAKTATDISAISLNFDETFEEKEHMEKIGGTIYIHEIESSSKEGHISNNQIVPETTFEVEMSERAKIFSINDHDPLTLAPAKDEELSSDFESARDVDLPVAQSTGVKPSLKSQKARTMFEKKFNKVLANVDFDLCDTVTCVSVCKIPSMKTYAALNKKLKNCERAWMEGFLEDHGLECLLEGIIAVSSRRVHKLSEALILLECVACVRSVMNSKSGLELMTKKEEHAEILLKGLSPVLY